MMIDRTSQTLMARSPSSERACVTRLDCRPSLRHACVSLPLFRCCLVRACVRVCVCVCVVACAGKLGRTSRSTSYHVEFSFINLHARSFNWAERRARWVLLLFFCCYLCCGEGSGVYRYDFSEPE